MISVPVYLRLCRLHASNKQLLKMYYSLFSEFSGDEALFYRREFSERISRREKIDKELNFLIKEIRDDKENPKILKAIGYSSLMLFSLDYIFQNMFFKKDLDRCQSLEIRNIEMYYEFLYAGTGKEEITEMLLDQKSEVEDSVYIEI